MAETTLVDARLFRRMRSLLEAITENDWDDGAADAVTCGMVWTKEAADLLAALAVEAGDPPTKGGPTEKYPTRLIASRISRAVISAAATDTTFTVEQETIVATGKKRRAHSSYRTLSMEKAKNKGLHGAGKQAGKRFAKRGPAPVGVGKRARYF